MVPQSAMASVPQAPEPVPANVVSSEGAPSADTAFPDLTLADVRDILTGSADAAMTPEMIEAARDQMLERSHPIGGCPPCLAEAGIAFNPAWTTKYCVTHVRELQLQLALRKVGEDRAASLRVFEAMGQPAPCALTIECPDDELTRLHETLIDEAGKTVW